MEVKIGCLFASIVMENLLIDSRPVFGLIITLPTQEHLTIPSLLLGLPDSITKHNTLQSSMPHLFQFSIIPYSDL